MIMKDTEFAKSDSHNIYDNSSDISIEISSLTMSICYSLGQSVFGS